MRGQKVILDSDLAQLYGVTTKRLNEQVKRNGGRFPGDFMFQLTDEEAKTLRSQTATSKKGRGGRRYNAHAFTEHGAIMAATVLNSEKAVQMSIYVVRAFVKLRQLMAPFKEMEKQLSAIQKTLQAHGKQIISLWEMVRLLMPPPEAKPKRPFGFHGRKAT
jgi:hypothetical protein